VLPAPLAISSRGPGRRPLTAETRVRIPVSLPSISKPRDLANFPDEVRVVRVVGPRMHVAVSRLVRADYIQDVAEKKQFNLIDQYVVVVPVFSPPSGRPQARSLNLPLKTLNASSPMVVPEVPSVKCKSPMMTSMRTSLARSESYYLATTLMVRLAVAVALGFAASVTVTVKLLFPAAVGVPLISPVELSSDNQVGKSF
jgi:hypothetical protein